MITQLNLSVREAAAADRQKLANLIHFEVYVHRHLDWRAPLDWMGSPPYLLAEKDGRLVAALASPPEPAAVSWVRLFAASSQIALADAWNALWPSTLSYFQGQEEVQVVAAIPLQRWFEVILRSGGFEQTHRVVMLSCDLRREMELPVPGEQGIRPMNFDDLQEVSEVDQAAFPIIWQNSRSSLEMAFRQAAVASVVDLEGKIIAYQISTATPLGGHLARLAVHPDFQGNGIGYNLVQNMLEQFRRRGAQMVSVNTQQDNLGSLALYDRIGFRRTGEEYPVYQYFLHGRST